MGKSSPPPAPTPPSAQEIAAANVDTAVATSQLQRAMQFGDEVMKDGYVREKLGIPQGAERVYETQTIKQDAPEKIGEMYVVKDDGTLDWDSGFKSGWKEGYFNDRYVNGPLGEHIGKNVYEFLEEHPNTLRRDGSESGGKWNTSGDKVINTKVKTLSGYKGSNGELTKANRYYKVNKDGTRSEVERHEALQADFTGMSDVDLARKQWEFEKETSPERTKFFLDQLEENYPRMTDLARKVLESTDPTGFKAREMLGKLAMEYEPSELAELPQMQEIENAAAAERLGDAPDLAEVGTGDVPIYERVTSALESLPRLGETPTYEEAAFGDVPSYERAGEMDALRRVGDAPEFAEIDTMGPTMERAAAMDALERSEAAPELERLDDIPEILADPTSLAGRRYAEEQFIDRAQEGRTSRLMAEQAQRAARGRAAATGNIFGGGAVLEEARAVRQAEDAGQRQALSDLIGFLQSGQTAGDYESRLAQQNLANRLMGIQQRTGAEQAEFGMGQQVLAQRNQAAMQERADELAALGQRNQAQQQEYQNLQASLAQMNQARQAQFDADVQAAGFDNAAQMQERADELAALGQRNQAEEAEFQNLQTTLNQINQAREAQFRTDLQRDEFNTQQRLRERADELGAIAQRNQAEESEYQGLLQALQQQQGARTAEFGMQERAVAQRNQAGEADFAREQAAIAQRNQARQQSFANAMQRTATQEQMKQQQMQNLQSFSGLAPVSQQFGGGMGVTQQGMGATFNPIQYTPTNAFALLGQQQQLQGNLFGTQSQNWATQAQMANQPSAFGQILGGVGGAVLGGWAGSKSGSKAISGLFD